MDVPPPVVTVQLSVGERIGQHYILISQIGAGAFGAIFSVKYEHRDVKKKLAVKFEEGLRPFTFLHNEMVVLKSLAGIRHFAKYYQQGVHKNYRYIVMELLGPSMIEVVNRQKPYKFTLSQALKFGIQGIESLASIHDQGFVHRDIKPGNFVIGNTVETSGIFYLIDFGLCKRLQVKDGVVIKPPQNGNFRGTMRYASIQAHNKEELGRNDDLMSLFYIIIEFYVGKLPWLDVFDKDEVHRLKENFRTSDLLINQLPKQFLEIERYLSRLDYIETPDYEKIKSMIRQIANDNYIDLDQNLEWENEFFEQRRIVQHQHMEEKYKLQQNLIVQQTQIQQIELSKYKQQHQQLLNILSNNNKNIQNENFNQNQSNSNLIQTYDKENEKDLTQNKTLSNINNPQFQQLLQLQKQQLEEMEERHEYELSVASLLNEIQNRNQLMYKEEAVLIRKQYLLQKQQQQQQQQILTRQELKMLFLQQQQELDLKTLKLQKLSSKYLSQKQISVTNAKDDNNEDLQNIQDNQVNNKEQKSLYIDNNQLNNRNDENKPFVQVEQQQLIVPQQNDFQFQLKQPQDQFNQLQQQQEKDQQQQYLQFQLPPLLPLQLQSYSLLQIPFPIISNESIKSINSNISNQSSPHNINVQNAHHTQLSALPSISVNPLIQSIENDRSFLTLPSSLNFTPKIHSKSQSSTPEISFLSSQLDLSIQQQSQYSSLVPTPTSIQQFSPMSIQQLQIQSITQQTNQNLQNQSILQNYTIQSPSTPHQSSQNQISPQNNTPHSDQISPFLHNSPIKDQKLPSVYSFDEFQLMRSPLNVRLESNINNSNENSKKFSHKRIKLASIIKQQSDNDLMMKNIKHANFIGISSVNQLMSESALKVKIKTMENEMNEENMKILLQQFEQQQIQDEQDDKNYQNQCSENMFDNIKDHNQYQKTKISNENQQLVNTFNLTGGQSRVSQSSIDTKQTEQSNTEESMHYQFQLPFSTQSLLLLHTSTRSPSLLNITHGTSLHQLQTPTNQHQNQNSSSSLSTCVKVPSTLQSQIYASSLTSHLSTDSPNCVPISTSSLSSNRERNLQNNDTQKFDLQIHSQQYDHTSSQNQHDALQLLGTSQHTPTRQEINIQAKYGENSKENNRKVSKVIRKEKTSNQHNNNQLNMLPILDPVSQSQSNLPQVRKCNLSQSSLNYVKEMQQMIDDTQQNENKDVQNENQKNGENNINNNEIQIKEKINANILIVRNNERQDENQQQQDLQKKQNQQPQQQQTLHQSYSSSIQQKSSSKSCSIL